MYGMAQALTCCLLYCCVSIMARESSFDAVDPVNFKRYVSLLAHCRPRTDSLHSIVQGSRSDLQPQPGLVLQAHVNK
jgi:hypothetical protein